MHPGKLMLRGASFSPALLYLGLLAAPFASAQDELILTLGAGSQPHAEQYNESLGLDYSFYRYVRSERQHLQLGVSYTRLRTDTAADYELWAISIYPQLSLYPDADSRFRAIFPGWVSPYFFVRALGPTYLSDKQLGDREQAKHFSFQAQVGFGLALRLGDQRQGLLSVSWKHFSNGSLFKPNDGIDVPVVLSLGLRL